jgi:nicotinate-nucleotide adenylyltransferase
MRLGIYGGTFDPVHFAHLLLAEQCREQMELDEVWFMPAATNPHKLETNTSSPKDRLAMLRLAIAGLSGLAVSELEINRGGTSYTVDTLTDLKSQDASRELFLLIGADSLADLPTWREPRRIIELAHIVAVNRGRKIPPLDEAQAALGVDFDRRLTILEMPGVDLAATDIRRRVAEGKSIRFMTPPAVERYILEHRLYRE